MPTYEVTGPSGTVIEMEGANPPSQSDIDAAFASIQPQAQSTPQDSGGAKFADLAAAAYSAPAPNIGANLNLQQAKQASRAGLPSYSLAQATPIAKERPYDIIGAVTGSGGSEAKSFTQEFRAAPVGQAFQDRELGAIVKTGDNSFQRVGAIPAREQTAGDISTQFVNQLSNADIGGALKTVQPGFNTAGNMAVRSGGLVASALAPELRLPGIILGSTGELAGQAIDAESAGQDPLNWRNYSLPGIIGSGLVSTVGSGATAPTLRQAVAQGVLEGGALQAPGELSSLTEGPTPAQIDPNTSLPTGAAKYEQSNILPMLAMGAGARGGHAIGNFISDLRNARNYLPPIESGPASYTDAGIQAAQGALTAEGNQALADAFRNDLGAAQNADSAYQQAVAQQAPAQAQAVLDNLEAQGAVNAQRQGAVLDNPATPQSSQALAQQLAEEQAAAARAAQQQQILSEAGRGRFGSQGIQSQAGSTSLTPILGGAGAGGVVGGAIGSTQGDTQQERALNSIKGLVGGGVLGGLAGAGAARLAQPELNAGEKVLQQASKPPSLANIVAETASKVEGSPAGTQQAANALTNTPQLPTISEAAQKQSALSSIKDKVVSGIKKVGNALTQGDTNPRLQGDYGATPDAVKGGPAPVGSYSGVQEGANGEKIDLFHLNQPVYDDAGKMVHPAGSDVSRESLEKLGFIVPDPSTLPPTKGAYAGEMTGEQYNALRAQEAQAQQAVSTAVDNLQTPALKPIPEDAEFLYEQKYNGRNGPKTERYYQVDRTPENPRGRTVDESTLQREGYDISQLPRPDNAESGVGSSKFAGAIGSGGNEGKLDRRTLGILGASTVGGLTGGAIGYYGSNEKDDKLVNSVVDGLVGGFIGGSLGAGLDGVTRARVANELGVIKRGLLNQSIPRIAQASEASSDAVFRYASAPNAAKDVARDLQAKILGGNYKSADFSKKLGSVWQEEQLLATKKSLLDRAANAATPEEAAKLTKEANDVVSTIGRESYFKTEDEFRAALNDPEIKRANEVFKQTLQPLAEANHLLTGGFESRADYEAAVQEAIKNGESLPSVKLAEPGPNTGVFVNTQALFEGAEESKGGGGGKGNLRNPQQKRSAFSKGRTGTAENYNVDANSLIERMVKGNFEDAAKRNMYAQLEKDGLGVSLPSGERPPDLDTGRYGTNIPIEYRGSGEKNLNFWPDKSIAGELGQALNTDGPLSKTGILSGVRAVMNATQLKALTDPVVHTANMFASIASAPGGSNFLTQVVRGMPIAGTVDALGKVGSKLVDVLRDTPEVRAQIARLSEAGAIRPEFSEANWMHKLIQNVDKSGRLVLDDLYQTLVDRNLVADTESGRRNFANRMGQYNSRLMGNYDSILKESGVSPFLVAGKNFNAQGLRQVGALAGLSTGGVEAASKLASLQLRAAQTIGAYSTLVVVPAALNYLRWGDPGGPPGTPIGKVALYQDDKGKMAYFDPAQLTLLRRGLRETGLQAAITGAQTGDNLNHIGGQAFADIRNSVIHPYAGPVPTFASTLLTGSNPSFHKVAPNVTPIGQSSDTLRQLGANATAAFQNINPLQGAFTESARPKKGEEAPGQGGSILPGLANTVGDLIGAVGIRKAEPLSTDTGELHTAQDIRFEKDKNRKAIVQSLADTLVTKDGKLSASPEGKAALNSPAFKKALTENPLEAGLLVNELQQAIKDRVEQRSNKDIAAKFNVASGERAQFYLNKLSELKGQEAKNYLLDQAKKGYLDSKVMQQMNYLKANQASGSR